MSEISYLWLAKIKNTLMERIKTGLASFGMSGKVFHGPLLHTSNFFEIKSIVERNRADSREKYSYTKLLRSFDELCADPEIELIIVNTPDYLHYEMSKKALLSGKHVVVEKPFTQTTVQAEDLIQIAEKNDLIISVFQNRRWDGDFLTIQKVLTEGYLGRLVEYEAHFDRYRNFIQQNTWKEEGESGVGTVFNLGSHLIDQALVLFDLPKAVYADIRTLRTGGKIDDNFELLLKYDDIKVSLKGSYLVKEPGPKYLLHGTEGSFLKWGIDPQEEALKQGNLPLGDKWGMEEKKDWGKLNTLVNGLHLESLVETIPGNYHAYYNNIYNAIRKKAGLNVKPQQSANVIRIIEAGFLSSREGRDIIL